MHIIMMEILYIGIVQKAGVRVKVSKVSKMRSFPEFLSLFSSTAPLLTAYPQCVL